MATALTTPARLAPRALYEEVAEQLRQRIFQRQLQPGSWIDELKLARQYGISRTPLREALSMLAQEGALAAVPLGLRVAVAACGFVAFLLVKRSLFVGDALRGDPGRVAFQQ